MCFRSLCLALCLALAAVAVVVVVVSPSFVSGVASRLVVGLVLGLCPCRCRWTPIVCYWYSSKSINSKLGFLDFSIFTNLENTFREILKIAFWDLANNWKLILWSYWKLLANQITSLARLCKRKKSSRWDWFNFDAPLRRPALRKLFTSWLPWLPFFPRKDLGGYGGWARCHDVHLWYFWAKHNTCSRQTAFQQKNDSKSIIFYSWMVIVFLQLVLVDCIQRFKESEQTQVWLFGYFCCLLMVVGAQSRDPFIWSTIRAAQICRQTT